MAEPYPPGSKEWWLVRYIAHGDVREPWYGLSDEDIAALSGRLADYDRARAAEDHYLDQLVKLIGLMRYVGGQLIAAADEPDFKNVPPPPPPPPAPPPPTLDAAQQSAIATIAYDKLSDAYGLLTQARRCLGLQSQVHAGPGHDRERRPGRDETGHRRHRQGADACGDAAASAGDHPMIVFLAIIGGAACAVAVVIAVLGLILSGMKPGDVP